MATQSKMFTLISSFDDYLHTENQQKPLLQILLMQESFNITD